LIQLSSTGVVSYLPYLEGSGNASTDQAATWSKVVSLENIAPASNTNGSVPQSGSPSASASATAQSHSSGTTSNGSLNYKAITRLSTAALILVIASMVVP